MSQTFRGIIDGHFMTSPKSPQAGPEISLTETVFRFLLFPAVSVYKDLGNQNQETAMDPAKIWQPQR